MSDLVRIKFMNGRAIELLGGWTPREVDLVVAAIAGHANYVVTRWNQDVRWVEPADLDSATTRHVNTTAEEATSYAVPD